VFNKYGSVDGLGTLQRPTSGR